VHGALEQLYHPTERCSNLIGSASLTETQPNLSPLLLTAEELDFLDLKRFLNILMSFMLLPGNNNKITIYVPLYHTVLY